MQYTLIETYIFFQSKNAKTNNYGPEFLKLMQIINNRLIIKDLQIAILSNIFINLSGKLNTNFKINRFIKFLNSFISIIKRNRLSLTKLLSVLLDEIIFTMLYILQLKIKLKEMLFYPRKNKYLPKDIFKDIWTIAIDLCEGNFV